MSTHFIYFTRIMYLCIYFTYERVVNQSFHDKKVRLRIPYIHLFIVTYIIYIQLTRQSEWHLRYENVVLTILKASDHQLNMYHYS